MSLIQTVFPAPEDAIELEPEEFALPLIEVLCRYESQRGNNMMHRVNFINSGHLGDYAGKYLNQILRAMTEAWMWLEREGLIAPHPEQYNQDWRYITKRGYRFREMADVQKFKAANLFPTKIFDSTLASKSRPAFLRGEYDPAVFQAFKEVEIRVRKLSRAQPGDLGAKLMRVAFDSERGILTDFNQEVNDGPRFFSFLWGNRSFKSEQP